eukprot:4326127-Prymnesium_polylepis.2
MRLRVIGICPLAEDSTGAVTGGCVDVDVEGLTEVRSCEGRHRCQSTDDLDERGLEEERSHDALCLRSGLLRLEVVERLQQYVQLRDELVVETNHSCEP